MANKFGKFLLCTAAIGTAAAAAYYFLSKKDSDFTMLREGDDDYDDFSDDLDDEDISSRNYVPLNRESTDAAETVEVADNNETATAANTSDFTPLAEQFTQVTEEKTAETIEEFFDDEDDDAEEEPLISDME